MYAAYLNGARISPKFEDPGDAWDWVLENCDATVIASQVVTRQGVQVYLASEA